MLNLVKTVRGHDELALLIGDLALTEKNFQYLMFDKFLLMKTLNKVRSEINDLFSIITFNFVARKFTFRI